MLYEELGVSEAAGTSPATRLKSTIVCSAAKGSSNHLHSSLAESGADLPVVEFRIPLDLKSETVGLERLGIHTRGCELKCVSLSVLWPHEATPTDAQRVADAFIKVQDARGCRGRRRFSGRQSVHMAKDILSKTSRLSGQNWERIPTRSCNCCRCVQDRAHP
eukprot:3251045-Rhodomonas_salina.1